MKILNVILGVAGVLIALAVWWGNRATDAANELIQEGNAKIELANKHTEAALEKRIAFDEAAKSEQMESMRKLAHEIAELYGKSSECSQEAAAKFQAASETAHDTVMKEYFGMEHKAAEKLTQTHDAIKKVFVVYADSANTDFVMLEQKATSLALASATLEEEYIQLKKAAGKYAAEHQDKLGKIK